MKKYFGLAAIALSIFTLTNFPCRADAQCVVLSAIPIRISTNSSGNAILYFRPHIINTNTIVTPNPSVYSYYWYANVSTSTSAGAAIVNAATDAVNHQTRIAIYGDVAACPAINTNGTIGNATVIVVNP